MGKTLPYIIIVLLMFSPLNTEEGNKSTPNQNSQEVETQKEFTQNKVLTKDDQLKGMYVWGLPYRVKWRDVGGDTRVLLNLIVKNTTLSITIMLLGVGYTFTLLYSSFKKHNSLIPNNELFYSELTKFKSKEGFSSLLSDYFITVPAKFNLVDFISEMPGDLVHIFGLIGYKFGLIQDRATVEKYSGKTLEIGHMVGKSIQNEYKMILKISSVYLMVIVPLLGILYGFLTLIHMTYYLIYTYPANRNVIMSIMVGFYALSLYYVCHLALYFHKIVYNMNQENMSESFNNQKIDWGNLKNDLIYINKCEIPENFIWNVWFTFYKYLFYRGLLGIIVLSMVTFFFFFLPFLMEIDLYDPFAVLDSALMLKLKIGDENDIYKTNKGNKKQIMWGAMVAQGSELDFSQGYQTNKDYLYL